jgi:hypothetical protein
MNSSTSMTIQELQFGVNAIFETQEKEIKSHLIQSNKTAEEILLEHLSKALQLLDRSTD